MFLQPFSLSLGVFPSAEPFRLEKRVVLVGQTSRDEMRSRKYHNQDLHECLSAVSCTKPVFTALKWHQK